MTLNEELARLAVDADAACDLAALALQLARDEYPDLDVEAYLSELAGMGHEAAKYQRGDLEARVVGLCRYLCHEMGFRGNQQDYYDPRNSYLNQVIDRRTGIPITLSLVAMTVGHKAGLDVQGVGLPQHFIVKAVDGDHEIFFDPFHGGRILTVEECELLVERISGRPFHATRAHLAAVPPRFFLQRMLTNVKTIYLNAGDHKRAAGKIERLLQLDPGNLVERRDLGVCLAQFGQHGRAIDHLTAYLASGQAADDETAVRDILAKAKEEVAKWN
jgi:regulator of sirC expression with transglutaminase-like and TPR domain